MGTYPAAPRKGEAASIHDRFDDHVWSRFRAVVQLGAVSKAVIFPAPDFLVVVAPNQEAAMCELQEHFSNAAWEGGVA